MIDIKQVPLGNQHVWKMKKSHYLPKKLLLKPIALIIKENIPILVIITSRIA